MIDYTQSAELNGVSVDELKAGFSRHPQSNKQVVAICDECGKVRNPNYKDYTDLCPACSCVTPEYRDNNSKRMIQYNIDNPELIEKMSGGHDIIMHHYLYDDADLSKYTMPMTRSEHTAMHNRMREDGYEVPHINSKTDDNGLWGYN